MQKFQVKRQLAKMTAGHSQIDKKALTIQKSWGEVNKLLQDGGKKSKNKSK